MGKLETLVSHLVTFEYYDHQALRERRAERVMGMVWFGSVSFEHIDWCLLSSINVPPCDLRQHGSCLRLRPLATRGRIEVVSILPSRIPYSKYN